MTIYNVRDYALPDAEPKRARPVLVGVVGVAVGLALGLAQCNFLQGQFLLQFNSAISCSVAKAL